MEPLIKAPTGKYKIVKIAAPGRRVSQRLMMLGIFEGDEIEVVKPAPGPVIIEKGGTRIGIGYGMASCIFVEKIIDSKK